MSRPGLLAGVVTAAMILSGCTGGASTPSSTPSASDERPFTVMTTQAPTRFDPAAAATAADSIVALNAFSRLMVVHPYGADLKPDLARDCLYTSPKTYQCDLPPGLRFHNGHALTASDVKFSIERAYRLSAPSSSITLFDSLERIDVLDELTVRFDLKYADTQFGYALATPAASIVDEEIYDPDALRPDGADVVGSGPYSLVTTAEDHLVFERFKTYRGAMTGVIDRIRLQFIADSAAAEQAMEDGSTDVVWRSLTSAALERVSAEIAANEGKTKSGFTRVGLPPVRMQRLAVQPSSPYRENAAVRAAVAAALQADRSVASLIPPAVTGAVPSFPVGGAATIPELGGQRLRLTLSYASASQGQRDVAGLLRDRLEERAGMSVQLVPDAADADLALTDEPAWVNTAFGWLQAYVDGALPGSRAKVDDLVHRARETPDADIRAALLAEIQQQAAVDLTLLPHSLGTETLLLGPGITLQGQAFGPAWQLGLWSLRA